MFVVSRMIPINRVGQAQGRRMIARADVYVPNFGEAGWEPGQSIEMFDVTSISSGAQQQRVSDYFTTAVRYGVDRTGILGSRGSLNDRLTASLFMSQFEPPRFNSSTNDPVGDRLATRRMVHGWDLGRWFTQPSLIITGVLDIEDDDANPNGMPTPLWINGQRVPASGSTLITWVYPFDPVPANYQSFDQIPESGDEESEDG